MREEITVFYNADPESIKVVYRDSVTKKPVKADYLNGNFNQTIAYHATLPAGYAFSRGQIIPTSVKFYAQNPDIVIWLDPLKTETNRYIRTIHYQYADGTKAADDYNLSFDFTRTQHVDKNGYAEWGAWNKDHIDVPDVISKVIPGYTATADKVPGRVVTPGIGFDEPAGPSSVPTLQEVITVIYNKNIEPNNGGQPTQPTQPTQPSTAPVLPEQPTTPSNPSTPGNPTEPAETVKPHATDNNNSQTTGKTEVNRNNNGNNGEYTVRPLATRVSEHAATYSKKQLPQTGDAENNAGVMGLLAAGLGIFGLAVERKRKN